MVFSGGLKRSPFFDKKFETIYNEKETIEVKVVP